MADKPKKGLLSSLKKEKIVWDDQPQPKKKGKTAGKKDGPQEPFWTVWLNKRKAKKANVRESSLPKPVMTKEDRMKLIAVAVIVVLIPVVFIILSAMHGSGGGADDKDKMKASTER